MRRQSKLWKGNSGALCPDTTAIDAWDNLPKYSQLSFHLIPQFLTWRLYQCMLFVLGSMSSKVTPYPCSLQFLEPCCYCFKAAVLKVKSFATHSNFLEETVANFPATSKVFVLCLNFAIILFAIDPKLKGLIGARNQPLRHFVSSEAWQDDPLGHATSPSHLHRIPIASYSHTGCACRPTNLSWPVTTPHYFRPSSLFFRLLSHLFPEASVLSQGDWSGGRAFLNVHIKAISHDRAW